METFFTKIVSIVLIFYCIAQLTDYVIIGSILILPAKLLSIMGFISDFKAFAAQGNVIDLAVGVVIGAAFGKIVTALVEDIIMPLFSLVTGGKSLDDQFYVLKPAADGTATFNTLEDATKAGASVLAYGHFAMSIVDFLIIAFFIFVAIRAIAKLHRKREAVPVVEVGPSSTDKLLTEIRDSLRSRGV
jgi:large conductance mechanosensitive channel